MLDFVSFMLEFVAVNLTGESSPAPLQELKESLTSEFFKPGEILEPNRLFL